MKLPKQIARIKNQLLRSNSPKVFGVGLNKTGTTSLKVAMDNLDFKCGDQRIAEKLFQDWKLRNFNQIIEHCKSAQFFQDIPFSLDYTYILMDHAFPNSKFILTLRNDEEQWYESVVKFHSRKWGKNGDIPTKEDLISSNYIYKGWAWDVINATFKSPENDPYNKDALINYYRQRNYEIQQYFKFRKDDLLILNIAQKGSYQELCEFLKKENNDNKIEFPWENRTEN